MTCRATGRRPRALRSGPSRIRDHEIEVGTYTPPSRWVGVVALMVLVVFAVTPLMLLWWWWK